MNSNKMTARIADTSQRKAAKIAGIAYLFIIIPSFLIMIFVYFKLVVSGNAAATVNNIMANGLRFRIGTAYELIMYASVVILALALYVLLKPVNKNLALLALFWRLVEATIGAVAVLSSLIVLLLINGGDYVKVGTVFETEQLHALVGLFLDIHSTASLVLVVFFCLGSTVFCYLFFKSKYIPRILAVFGIFSFLLLLIYTLVAILFPNLPAMIQIVCHVPGTLFEVIIGLWLLLKGVNVQQGDNRSLASL